LPVLDREAGHTGELAEVVGDDGGTEAEGLGGDEGIDRADTSTAFFQIRPESGVVSGVFPGKTLDGNAGDERLESTAIL
jgi:hypothetical protein